jgi:broad specificity phosphatase PhoE
MTFRYLYLVRHGQYDSSQPAPDHLEGGLTKLGHKQAEKTAKYLAHLPISALHISSLRRTSETAQPFLALFPDLKPNYTKRLWECVPYCSPEMRPLFAEIPDSQLAVEQAQAQQAYEYYLKPTRGKDRHEIIVAHGNIIRYFVARVLGAHPSIWLNMESRNCGITRMAIDHHGYASLISYNELGHLPATWHTDNMHL